MKRILCLLLALCCALPLAACAGPIPPIGTQGTTGSAVPEGTTPSEDITTPPNDSDVTTDSDSESDVTDNLITDSITGESVVDLNGYTYLAYVRGRAGSGAFCCEDFWVEQASTDVLDMAVYTRNQSIESAYNCHITQYATHYSVMSDELKFFYFNEKKYDLAIMNAAAAVTAACSCLLQDVYTLDAIQTDHDTYDQGSIKQFTMNGKLYYLSGDMNISAIDGAATTIFNPDLFTKYDFVELCGNTAYDNLYEMVADGTWTVSAMLEMAEAATVDVQKDGKPISASNGDTVGYLSYSAAPMFYWYGCGARISAKDPDSGYPTLVFGAEGSNSQTLFNFLFDNLNNKTEGNEWILNGGGGYRNGEFMSDQLLFTDIIAWDMRKVLSPQNKADYGILPIPKYNEAQDRYYSLVYWPYGMVYLWSIPVMCNNKENAAFMFHLMAQYSHAPDGTMAAYFNSILPSDVGGNKGSLASLKIVRNSLVYDYFLLYNWGNFIQALIEGLDTASSNQYEASVTEYSIATALVDMNQTLEKYKNPQLPEPIEN